MVVMELGIGGLAVSARFLTRRFIHIESAPAPQQVLDA